MAIAQESFQAIESFYGKMKASPHQKTKFINSIKKEINKISRIKDVNIAFFKNNYSNLRVLNPFSYFISLFIIIIWELKM